jgi:anti-sigma regulatory factor (Ser/Thr protein kinase)
VVPEEVELVLPSTPLAAGAARRFIADNAAPSLAGNALDDCILLGSELVTNAVRYGRPEVMVGVIASARRVRVSVRDHGAEFAPFSLIKSSSNETHGRGLFLVAALSATWGVSVLEECLGKTVWFTISTS